MKNLIINIDCDLKDKELGRGYITFESLLVDMVYVKVV